MPEWTPERRAAQAERIRATKPWLRSTGPKTAEGKAKCSCNAVKHGNRSAAMRQVAELLRLNREFRMLAPTVFLHAGRTDYMRELMKSKAYVAENNFLQAD